jgi:hypothetical protein
VAKTTGQWMWSAESLGFAVLWVSSSDTSLLPLWAKPAFTDAFFTTSWNLVPVDLIMCDGTPPGWLGDSWALTSLVVSTSAARPRSGLRDGWSQWTRLRHTELGGLTETEGHLRVIMYSRRALAFEACPPSPVLPTCVYSVAGDTIEAGLPSSGPITRVLHPLRVLALGKNLYYGGGLYPRCARGVRPTFLLPTVLHHPATWCRRRLTPLETWMVWDVPYRICVLVLQAPDSARVLGRLHPPPGRCLHEGLRRLLRGLGVMDDGGWCLFDTRFV